MENSYLLSYLTQLIQEKHGDDVELEFIETERERLELDIKEKLLNYFEPMLATSAKKEFERMLESETEINVLMQFLFGTIDNLEEKIFEFLDKYKADYGNA
ncbi:hypothetical protein GF389_05165 [Candidatus Dojkabacteria bacterium]|nr:hypothetical protein [Candidatus Dojkabacteria bacterium]